MYVRPFNTAGIYLNHGVDEYNNNVNTIVENLRLGTARFETLDVNGKMTNSCLLTYEGDLHSYYLLNTPPYDWSVYKQLRLGGNLRWNDWSSYLITNAMYSATHLRYTSLYKDVRFKLNGNRLYLNKADMDTKSLSPSASKITVDGLFTTAITPWTGADTTPLAKIRSWKSFGRKEQIAIVSSTYFQNYPLFVIDLGKNLSIGYLAIQIGDLYKPTSYDNNLRHPQNFTLTLKYCDKDVPFSQILDSDFYEISEKTNELSVKNGDALDVTSSDLGDNFKARYIKFFVSHDSEPDITDGTTDNNGVLNKWYGASISGLQIYESDIIVSEKSYDSDVINLYKDSTVYEQLYTQDMLDYYANTKLEEFKKDNTLVDTSIAYSPHLQMGQTVLIDDVENGISRNYFIQSINSNNGGLGLTLAYYE